MANVSRPCGLMPIESPYGSVRIHYYKAETADAIFRYSPVCRTANGTVAYASSQLICGAAINFLDSSKAAPLANPYMPASTDSYIGVADDPDQLFLIEEDTGGTALTSAAINAGCDFISLPTVYGTGSGSTTSGLSGVQLDRSAVNTTDQECFKLLGILDQQDNAYGNYAKWIVKIAQHQDLLYTATSNLLV